MRICILSPGALGSNPRVVKEANAFSEAGHQVTTISTRTLDAVDRLDDAVLAKAAWRAIRLDFRSRGNLWRLRRAGQIAAETAFSLPGAGSLADRAIGAFTAPLAAAAKQVAADLYIAHYPSALPAAARAARVHRARYAYDAEDFHYGEWPDRPEFERARRLLVAVEGRYLANCTYVTAASPGIADAYVKAYGIARPTVVLNVFPRVEAPAAPTAAGNAVPGPSIYWFSQTIGPDRGLQVAVEAIGRARTRPHLYLRGSPAAGYVETLHRIAIEAGASERLHLLRSESPLLMVELAAGHDLGLSSEPGHNRNNELALGNKLFTYLLAGVPVLLSDVPAHREFVQELGRAAKLYAAEDADSLAAAIDALLGDPSALAESRAAAFRLGQRRYNWDVEKLALIAIVAQAATCSGTAVSRPNERTSLTVEAAK